MFQIALAGSLAHETKRFSAANVRTPVYWTPLPRKERELARLDLVLQLRGDDKARTELERVQMLVSPKIVYKCDHYLAVWELDTFIQRSLAAIYGFIVGYGTEMETVCRQVRAVAHHVSSVLDLRTLVVGETGTGKEMVASAIHQLRPERGPFVGLNCSGMPSSVIDSELFGHVRGAFTGAVENRAGALASAAGGVLFLDEIGDLPAELQGKLLRVLDQREFRPIGSDRPQPLQARVVSATNKRLDEAVKQETFRADLYFRLAQVCIILPALRERADDIPLLLDRFLRSYDLTIDVVPLETLRRLQNYPWPGNIRQLRTAVERFVLLLRAGEAPESINWVEEKAEAQPVLLKTGTLTELREEFDRRVLEAVIERCGGDTAQAARELDISRRSIYNLIHRHGIRLKQKKEP